MSEYLPPKATAAEAVAWLEKNTSEAWSLARIVETGIWPWFRFDYSPEHAHMFGDRFEGYAAQMTFGGDKQRLVENASDPDFLVTMFYVPAGILSPNEELVRTTPIFLPMSALRFAREDIQRIASVLQRADDKTVERSKPDWHENKPISRHLAQEREILRTIAELGYEAKALPKHLPGKPGARAEARTALEKNPMFVGGTVFDKAWQRLRDQSEIQEKS